MTECEENLELVADEKFKHNPKKMVCVSFHRNFAELRTCWWYKHI